MDSARWERIQALFHDAVDLPLGERGAFLRDACGRDDALLAEVLASLDEDERGGSLLDEGVANAARRVLGDDPATLRQIGPYSILRTLGEGGMGVVYLAERTDLGTLVAIKILRDAWLSPAREVHPAPRGAARGRGGSHGNDRRDGGVLYRAPRDPRNAAVTRCLRRHNRRHT